MDAQIGLLFIVKLTFSEFIFVEIIDIG